MAMAAGGQQEMAAAALASHMCQAAKVVEERLDEEIKRLDNMDDDELERVRQRRVHDMKAAREQRERWAAAGHGVYSELGDERDFFDACKRSKRLVCHFYEAGGDGGERSKLIDKHLAALAAKHVETRFVKADATKVPFLIERLNIRVRPTLAVVKDGKTEGYMRGSEPPLSSDEFSAAAVESLLGRHAAINYTQAEQQAKPAAKGVNRHVKQNLRGQADSDSEGDW